MMNMIPKNKIENMDNNFITWYMHINGGILRPLRWQKPLLKVLQSAMMGKVSKILVSAPPQHGKTMLMINAFASLYMCNNPNDKVIVTAYSQQRATKYGLTLRNLINRYGQNTMFRPRLSQDQQSKTNFIFDYPHTGELLATGSHGSIMGNPANLIIIDDPIKELKEATSKVMQESLEEWYIGSINTRLRKNDVKRDPILIVVAQRLNQHDLQGILQNKYKVLENREAMNRIESMEKIPKDTIINLNFPALCENPETDILGRQRNEALWKQHKNTEDLLIDRKMMGEYRFRTIMQGDPQEYLDYLFTHNMFYNENEELTCTIPYTDVPPTPQGRFWDTAGTTDNPQANKGDYFAGIKGGYDYWNNETLYIYNMRRGKRKALEVARLIKRTIVQDGPDAFTFIQQEPGSLSPMFLQTLQQEFEDYEIMFKPAPSNKSFSSVNLQTLASTGRLKFVVYPHQDTEWIYTIIDELTHFDGEPSDAGKGKHDDIVDSLSMAANYFVENRDYYAPYTNSNKIWEGVL